MAIVSKERSIPTMTVVVPDSEIYRLSTGDFLSTLHNVPLDVASGFEHISYTNSTKQKSNWCRHLKRETIYTGDPLVSKRFDQPGSDVFYKYYGHHRYSVDSHSSAVTAAKTSLGVNLAEGVLGSGAQGYINDVAKRLRPDLTTVSVPNFLAELDDIKSLVKLWKKNISLAKNVAGLFLNYKFGWKPTIGDVQAMVSSVTGFQQKLAEFERSLDVLFKRRTIVERRSLRGSGSFAWGPASGTCKWSITMTSELSAGIAWRPQPLAVMSNFEKNLRGLLDTLGFQLNPRIIWDEIPFSFVVDWFFGVGAWLENFSIDTLELPIKYVDSYLQYKEVIRIESSVLTDVGSTSIIPHDSPTPSMITSETYFQRMPIFPDFATLEGLGWKVPTNNQKLLLVSLATVLTPSLGIRLGKTKLI